MAGAPLWELMPHVMQYVYWHRKEQFALHEDQYPGWMMFAVEDGSFSYEFMDHSGTASFGDITICPPGAMFRRKVETPLSFHFIMFDWLDMSGQRAVSTDSVPAGKITIKDRQRLSSTYSCMNKLTDRSDPFRMSWINHLLRDIWQLYCFESSRSAAGKAEVQDSLIEKAKSHIQRHAFQSCTMKSVAAALGLNPVQFTRRFQAACGVTPVDFLTDIRLEKARLLLTTTSLTLQQISEQCGYENGFYLSRVFSKKMNMSPSEYRRTHQV